ncbi:unnamed protein product, partial [Closterium sp. NIES-54]
MQFIPPRANVVDGMWLFKVKRPPGSPPVFKARCVARGFSQREGVDFFHTFAPTPKMTTLRVLLHIVAERDYELHSLDFSTPFLQGRLHEEIWLCRPPGFTGTFPTGTHSTPFFILVYVDNLVLATPDRAALAEVKSELQKRHTCTDLGEMQRYLGLQITRDRASRTITLTLSHMVQQVLQRVAKYLATTSGMGLVLGGTRPVELTGLCDSSYADVVKTQRSTQGYCFSLGAGAVSWRSTRSSSVASTSAEAEIYAGAMAAQELRWLTFLLADLGERPHTAPTLFADNKAIILLCCEPRLETRVKHIDVRYFLLRELQRRGQVRLDFVASEANTVDLFTKALAPAADSGASGGAEHERAEPGGAGSGGAEPERTEPGGAGSGGAEPERAGPGGVGSGGVEPVGAGPGGPSGALSLRELPSPRELREWFARRLSRAAGAGGAASAGGSAAARGSGAGGAAGAGTGGSASAGGAGATGPGGARTGGIGATGPGGAPGVGATGGARAGGAAGVGATGGTEAGAAVSTGGFAGAGAAGGTGAGGAAGVGADVGGTGVVPAGSGGTARPRPYFIPLLEQVLGLPPSPSPAPSLACPPPVQSESQLQLVSPLPAPSPYAGPTGGLAERRGPESRPASPVRTARTSRRVPRQRPPAVPSTHQMALRPSTASQRVPLPSPPASSLLALADPESDSLRAASPTVTRVLATVVTDPSFESTAASAFVAELSASVPACPPSVGGECALSTDVLEDRQEEFQCFAATLPHLVSTLLAPEGDPDAPDIPTPHSYAKAIEGPYSSQWQAAMDAEMASWKSTGTYVDDIPPPGANIVSGMWIFRVKRPPGSPPVFKARYVARGFSQRQGVDYFQTFSLTPKMTTLRVLLHLAAQRDYELHSLDFNTAFLQGSLHEEIWLRRPPGFTGSFPAGTQWSLWRPVYGLRQAPREWHDTLRTTLASLGFAPSTADPSLFLRTDTLLPPFYILVYVVDDNFFQCPSLHSPLARSLNRNYHFQPQG